MPSETGTNIANAITPASDSCTQGLRAETRSERLNRRVTPTAIAMPSPA